MKKLLPALFLFMAFPALAQETPENAYNILDINNIKTRVNALGDMWWNPETSDAACEYPAGSGKNIGYAGSLWMACYDDEGSLHVAAQTYRQDGVDFYTGPTFTASDSVAGAKWARVWKINKTDIDDFLAETTHTLENVPASILEWPARKNPYAKGSNGTPLTILLQMAPFVDVDSNGEYNPLLGDYPEIKGDQMLWSVYSDNTGTHEASGGTPLNVTVKRSVYGYNRGTVIDDVVFYEFEIENASNFNYNDFRSGFFGDMDLGYGFDDYIGLDSARRMVITFNGDTSDLVYGDTIPAVGLILLETPGDVPGAKQPIGSLIYFNNDASETGNPSDPIDYYYYLHGQNKSGVAVHHDSLYQVNMSAPNGDSYECLNETLPYDRRFIMSTANTPFASNATLKFSYAMVAATAGGCPDADFTDLGTVADTAIGVYGTPLPTGIATVKKYSQLKLYPNPAQQELNFNTDKQVTQVSAVNTLGQITILPFRQDGQKIITTVAALPSGVYTLSVSGKDYRQHAVFIRQ